jgi:hypothetical protein
MNKGLLLMSLAALLCFSLAPARAEEEADEEVERKYYLKADLGVSLPMLENLDNELAAQGNDGVPPGLSFGVSLGRAFAGHKWTIEIFYSVAYYPEFTYQNEYEDFPGDLRHNVFGGYIKRRFRTDASSFIPALGIGFGYGTTNLIAGGGKLKGPEALAIFEIEAWTWGNKSLIFNCTYTLGLTEGTFKSPFLENFADDMVRDSNGDPLNDRYSSLDLKIGILIWLTPLGY